MSRIWRQKGLLLMTEIQKMSALRLSWDAVSRYFEALLSALLGRAIVCNSRSMDDSYWSVAASFGTFTNAEIVKLAQFVNGDDEMLIEALPPDSDTSRSLGMELCRALLKYALKLDWATEFVSDDGLYILGHFPENVQLPAIDRNVLYVDSKVIDCSKLIPMNTFVEKLFGAWGTFSDLTELCEEYQTEHGTPLYWMYPFTDGRYNGCYFVLVREGIMAISYDEIDGINHESFVKESARLCDAAEIRCFLNDWKQRADEMTETLSYFLSFLERKEAVHGA